MKKVLYTATVVSHICQFHLPYLKMLKEKGYEVHVAAHDNLAEKNGLQLKYVDKFIEVPFSRSPTSPQNIKAYKQLKKLFNEEYYDLIVCNTPMGGIVTRKAAKKTRKKGTKVVYIAHGFHFFKGGSKKNWLFYYPIEKHFAKKCDALVTITNEDYQLAQRKFKTNVLRIHGAGVDEKRHYPISEEEKQKIRIDFGVEKEAFVCLCTGELNVNKNQKQLIQLAPRLKEKIPNFQLWLAGNGPLKDELEKEIERQKAQEYVTLLGYKPNIESYIRMCDVVLSASKREGLPFNIVEAMLTKRPVVTTINRGHRELITHSGNGFMTNDWEVFCDSIVSLYKDKKLYNYIIDNAYQSIQVYTVENVRKEIISCLIR